MIQAAVLQDFPVAGMPAPLPGTPVDLAGLRGAPPPTIRWTETIPAAAISSPVIVGEVVLVAHLPGIVAAHHREDGRRLWRVELNPVQPLATDGTLLFVAAGDAIHAVRLADGSPAWRVPSSTLTAPLLVKDGWLIGATEGALTARRASDGATIWTTASGVQREAPAISGDVLFVPLVDGRLVARNLLNGVAQWAERIGGSPGEPLVVGDDIFLGGSDMRFYCLDAASGETAWSKRVGARIRGRASTDGERIFFTALDHLVRAVDRLDGAERWHKGVPFRPLHGPVVAGGAVYVAGSGREVHALRAADGERAGTITLPARNSFAPAYAETPEGLVIAAVTGELDESWKLSLTAPIPRRGTP